MAKKKRSSKKKQRRTHKPKGSQSQGNQPKSNKPKAEELEATRQTWGQVMLRLCGFVLVTTGIFYVLLNHATGGNALWKVALVGILPYIYLPIRRQAFQAPGFVRLLRPNGFKIIQTIGALALTFGACVALFRFGMEGRPSEDTLVRVLGGIVYALNPVFAFLLKLKVTTWAAFSSLAVETQGTLVVVGLLYFYSCVVLVDLEKNHLPAKQEPLYMLQV